MPVPWLLGPMLAVLIGSKLSRIPLYWPAALRHTGLVLVSYSIGLSFTREAMLQIMKQLPSMLVVTLLTLGLCVVTALIVSRLSGIDYPTIATGSVPGGLSQMITLAEEMKDIDVTTVAFFQVTRLILIVFCIPLLIFSPWFGGFVSAPGTGGLDEAAASWGALWPDLLLYAAACIAGVLVAVKLKLPTAYMLGPILAIAALTMIGFPGPTLPSGLLSLSQFMIGGYVGLLLKPGQLNHRFKLIAFAICSGVVLIAGSWIFSIGLTLVHPVSETTSFLSVAPGGMDQMSIIAHEVRADLSMVSGYQLFRLFFIYFAVPPLLKLGFRYYRLLKVRVQPARHVHKR
ncbi:AbrB family transcriptional regulator [Paenibacillus sp. y28]